MSPWLARARLLVAAVPVVGTLLVPTGVAWAENPAAAPICPPAAAFDRANFPQPTRIDNRFLPMVPGQRRVYEGQTSEGSHRVVFTVTDLVKVVNGVMTRVVHDVDIQEGQVVEAELAFFAQDAQGRVWNLGEYPEEFEDGQFVGAPSTWLAGRQNAQAGVHMLARPEAPANRNREYLQGRAPAIDFLDCARVVAVGGQVRVPAGSFTGVLTVHERSPLESATAIQTKEHAPNVGIVRIGAIADPEGETLSLTRFVQLSPVERSLADVEAVRLDNHGRRTNPLYRTTLPVLPG